MDQPALSLASGFHPELLQSAVKPYYKTPFGSAYLADAREVLRALPSDSINLAITSPPYALHFKKKYGNVNKEDYVEWFLTFASEIFRVLRPDGSFVLNIGGSYNKGEPTRSIYHFKLMLALVERIGFSLAQEMFWYNPAKMPMPAQWVTVERIRVKDSVEYVWWFSKTSRPKANNRAVLRPYSADMIRLNKRGVRATTRPSGHNITSSFDGIGAGGSIPPNFFEEDDATTPDDLMRFGNNAANDTYTLRCKERGLTIHPARFPATLPSFFVKFLTQENDLVIDPFAGSNTTGAVAEKLQRRWIAMDTFPEYLDASVFRFDSVDMC